MAGIPPHLLQNLPPNVIIHSPMSERAIANRVRMCWCADLDLSSGVDCHNKCRACDKFVFILDLERYKFCKCMCSQPIPNEFKYCYLCNFVIYNPDGTKPEEAVIGFRRALYMRTHNLVAR